MKKSNVRVTNVALFGVPRSGTTWLGQIFNSSTHVHFCYQPLFSYEFKDALNQQSTGKDISQFHRKLLDAKSDFVLQKQTVSGGNNVSFKKGRITTLVWKEVHHLNIIRTIAEKSDTRIILIIRNPKATISSWMSIPREFDPSWNIHDQWRSGSKKNNGQIENFFGFDKWKEASINFLNLEKKYPEKVKVIKYADLNDDTLGIVREIFNFVGLQIENQTMEFIKDSGKTDNDDPYSVYRKKDTDDKWKTNLPDEIISEIDTELAGTVLEKFNT